MAWVDGFGLPGSWLAKCRDTTVYDLIQVHIDEHLMSATPRKRVLSGMRSTGKLHLGNYVGALDNWVRMQDEYECFFFIADWHALTTDYADTSQIKQNSLEVLLDWLGGGGGGHPPPPLLHPHMPAPTQNDPLLSPIS